MAVSVQTRHPRYQMVIEDWHQMRDTYKGQRQIKSKGFQYLPPTDNQRADGADKEITSRGFKNYEAYKGRARYPNHVREAIQMAIGMMHSKPPVVKLPAGMAGIRSKHNENIPSFLRRINTEQLLTGRVAAMADIPTDANPDTDMPYLTTYNAELCINWDDGDLNATPQELYLAVIDEKEQVLNPMTLQWDSEDKYRVLMIVDGEYRQGVFGEKIEFSRDRLVAPQWRGNTLNSLPFVFINSCDYSADVDDPPLLDLSNICLTIYKADADYRQNLFMQGQDTLITIGGGFQEDDNIRVGAGNRIDLQNGGDAKYIGVDGSGLSEQREALLNLERRASSMGAQTLDTTSRERESGDSLRIRVAARTADLQQIAMTGAAGLEYLLKKVAVWIGEDPNEVEIKPNLDFGDQQLTGQSLVEILTARNLGAPISAETIHEIMVNRKFITTDYEEEVARAKKEEADSKYPFPKADTGDQNAMNGRKPSNSNTNPNGDK